MAGVTVAGEVAAGGTIGADGTDGTDGTDGVMAGKTQVGE